MKKTITKQLGIIIVSVIFVSMIITSFSNYWVSYKKTYEAAGIEAVGCANITTGLVNPSDLQDILNGNKEKQVELENTINWTTEHKRLFEAHYILNLDGTILAADENIKKQGLKAGDKFEVDQELVNMILETKHPHYSEVYEFAGMKRLTGFAPIFEDHDPNKEIIALNAIDFDAKIVTERTLDSVTGSFVLGLLPMIIASIVTIWLIRRKTKPITQLIQYAKKIADGDLSQEKLNIKNNDEIGELANTLNIMANNLRELIQQFRLSAELVNDSSKQLTNSVVQTNQATEQIATTMQHLANNADRQVNRAEETSHTVHEMTTGVQQIAGNAGDVSTTAFEASKKASEGGQAIHTAVGQMNKITDTVNSLSNMIKGLNDRSKEIGQIIEVITGIASQTNLLALNAAIEAARAGDHGSGFAVVADEVRKLAEQSAGSAQQISQLVATIQDETNSAVQSMEVATHEVSEGIGVVNKAGFSFTQIEDAINEVTQQIQVVSASVQQIASGAGHLVTTMTSFTEVEETVVASTHKVSSSIEEQLASMQEISSSANALSKMSEELQMHIRKFKI